ncbi:MAG: hypothetical protein HYV60_01825 [Planctomycetia bacterium]|nr:hypothetical protein [Planctomycetia bacterium]
MYAIGSPNSATVTIEDDDAPLTNTVFIGATQNATEGGSAGFFTIQRTDDSSDDLIVFYSIDASSTASATLDFNTALSGSITIPAGQFSVNVPLDAKDDSLVEGDEVLQITLTELDSPNFTIVDPATAAVTLFDNDTASTTPVITVDGSGNAAEGGADGYIRFARTGDTTQALTFPIRISDVYSTAVNGQDTAYVADTSSASPNHGTVTFAAGQQYVTIGVATIDDSAVEGTERLTVDLATDVTGQYSIGVPGGAVVQIQDNDTNVQGPYVTGLGLVNDTGASNTDRVTFDATLTGTVNGEFSGGYVHVEFDHDGNQETIEGQTTVQTSGASFTYDPIATDAALADVAGPIALRYRTMHYGSDDSLLATGSWRVFTISLVANPGVGDVRIEDLRLQRDTGYRDDDKVTINPVLLGSVLGDFQGGSVRLEFDHYGDGSVDGQLNVAQSGDGFAYDPRENDATVQDHTGAFQVKYRIVQLDGTGTITGTGDWNDFNLTLVKAPASNYTVTGLALGEDAEDVQYETFVIKGEVSLGWGGYEDGYYDYGDSYDRHGRRHGRGRLRWRVWSRRIWNRRHPLR